MKQLGLREQVKRGLLTEEQALLKLSDKHSKTFGWLTRRIAAKVFKNANNK